MAEGSKCFGPTAAAAATLTQIGSDYYMPPKGPWHIYKLRVGFANVVNAKECAGYVKITVSGESGLYEYIVGHGAGGATNSGGEPAHEIDVGINAQSGALVQVKGYNAEAIKDMVVSLHFRQGQGRKIVTYKVGGAGSDVTAGTELTIGTITIDQADGVIRQIRFTGSGVVDALAETAKLTLEVPGNELSPFEFAVGSGTAGAATTPNKITPDIINLPDGIPVKLRTVITVKILNLVTTGSALLSCAVSIQVV